MTRMLHGLGWLLLLGVISATADWPMLKGNARHDGFAAGDLTPPFRLAWAVHFRNERLGTAMEPIVSKGLVLVATHGGQLCALDAVTGDPRWRFQAQGAFLHSPACEAGIVVAASVDGRVQGLHLESGKPAWHTEEFEGGFSASPVIDGDRVFLGSRRGVFLAVGLREGRVLWRHDLGVPIRQTAAASDGHVYVTGEDLKVRAFSSDGRLEWTSEALRGQSARDYYPVIVNVAGKSWVVVRTNPERIMSDRIVRDRSVLAGNAGIDDKNFRRLEAWTRSEAAKGTPELWKSEQEAVRKHLARESGARTFFALDAATGKEVPEPVLWVGGCQGVGVPPAVLPDGRLLVLNRSAYGNWNRGVAPLVAPGLLDLTQGSFTPLIHAGVMEPPWNTFWGTADEAQSLVVLGGTVLIVHQGTLSGFEMNSRRLFPIWGQRDTFGGFRNLSWARNEWHGPARGGVAVDGTRLFWITGSRVICVQAGSSGDPAPDKEIDLAQVPGVTAPKLLPIETAALTKRLNKSVRELTSVHWAPLFVEPGLAGRQFLYDETGALFESLSWAYPFLEPGLQKEVRQWLGEEWENFPPYTTNGWMDVTLGKRREWSAVGSENLTRLSEPAHPFANLGAAALYLERCGEANYRRQMWPRLRACFEDFESAGWRLDAEKGDLNANRYLGSLIAFARLAEKAGDAAVAKRAQSMAEATAEALVSWWRRASREGAQRSFRDVAELDAFIAHGTALSFRLVAHHHKIALFHGLNPEVAVVLKARAREAVARVWEGFESVYSTWPLVGEERQVHYGENYIDSPDFALDAFRACAWLADRSPAQLARRVDEPFGRADLAEIMKIALVLEAAGR